MYASLLVRGSLHHAIEHYRTTVGAFVLAATLFAPFTGVIASELLISNALSTKTGNKNNDLPGPTNKWFGQEPWIYSL
jgi:hypothetical protein